MLYVTLRRWDNPAEREDKTWHVGERFDFNNADFYVDEVQADGDELEFIIHHCSIDHILWPYKNGYVCRALVLNWYGDTARWIVTNLIQNYNYLKQL